MASEFADLNAAEEAALAELPAELSKINVPDHRIEKISREERCSFLKVRKWVASDAAAQIKESLAWLDDIGVVTIEQVAPFMRTPPGRGTTEGRPDGCVILLEDGRGDCARDNLGRPVAVSIGMSHGSAREMQLQFAYTMQRARLYTLPGQQPGNTCTIIEVAPRDPTQQSTPTFRFPDADVRTLFDLQTRVYPSSLGTSTHFCGLPRAVVWAFRLCKPFMSAETYDNMKLKPDFSHLAHKHLPPSSMLPHWLGSTGSATGAFEFDIDEYIEWRAREEGVPLERLCPRGQGRAFSAAPSNEDAMNSDGSKRVSAADLLSGQSSHREGDLGAGGGDGSGGGAASSDSSALRKVGVILKQGSGKGLFGNRKWKEKLLVIQGGAALYFDSTDASSATNFVSRVIPLSPGCRVARTDEPPSSGLIQRGPAASFVLVTPSREFTFGADSEGAANEWVSALAKEIEASVTMGAAPLQTGSHHETDHSSAADAAEISASEELNTSA